ncbi:MAG: ATP-binding cassette domain-containing protein [Actinomycetota bacterium]|nr:ATP-binding cassette domain-containing protein [Actinomycetota bacterium]
MSRAEVADGTPDGTDGRDLDARIVVRRSATFTLDVTLRIAAGTTVALLGPNGAGKSTTVDALAGLVALDEGRITLGERVLDNPGADVFVPPDARRVGIVFQRYLLFDHLDVTDNVAFGPRSRGLRRRDARASARRWIDTLGLGDLAGRRPAELSGGQAQRVALARALATEPDLLLLDEPLAALDVTTRARLRRTLADHLAGYGGPRLLITHDPTDAFALADRICVVEGGRVTQEGTPDDIRRHPATPYVAALAGANRLAGTIAAGTVTLDDHPRPLHVADHHTSGRVAVTIWPSAIALHTTEPHGSPRNTWSTTVAALEPLGETTRVLLGDPLPLMADITPASATALGLGPGSAVWASIKATEITVTEA